MAKENVNVEVSKFERTIDASDKTIKGQRASILAKSSRRAAENKVRSLEDKVDTLESTILNLTDLAPDTTYSLRPGGKDFDAEGWFEKLYTAELELELANIQLAVASRLLKEWF
jgi:hypothetical protein